MARHEPVIRPVFYRELCIGLADINALTRIEIPAATADFPRPNLESVKAVVILINDRRIQVF